MWFREALASRRIRDVLHAVQRRLARRVVRAFRTAPGAATLVLAGLPPADFTADALAWCYARAKAIRLQGWVVTPRAAALLRERARRRTMDAWQESLANDPPATGTRILEAVLPHLDEWVGRPWGGLSYRMTQVLTGHGCFGEYLCRIPRKEPTTQCHHCDAMVDSAQHTLEICPAWDVLRGVLREEVGDDLSLRALVPQMVRREIAWVAVSSFCDQVMRQKEEAEKERERRGRGMPLPDNDDAPGGGSGGDDPPWLPPGRPVEEGDLPPATRAHAAQPLRGGGGGRALLSPPRSPLFRRRVGAATIWKGRAPRPLRLPVLPSGHAAVGGGPPAMSPAGQTAPSGSGGAALL